MRSGHNLKRMIVQQYIKDLTGKNILIYLRNDKDIELLEIAYQIAKKYKDEFKTTNNN